MNKIISIDGQVKSMKRTSCGGGLRLDKNGFVSCEKVQILKAAISSTIKTWESLDHFTDPIVSVKYIRVIPKSLRMGELFKIERCPVEKTIIGASFDRNATILKHILVYHLPMSILEEAIKKLDKLETILEKYFNRSIGTKEFKILADNKNKQSDSNASYKKEKSKQIHSEGLSHSAFCQLIQDVYFIEDIYIDTSPMKSPTSDMLISFYDIGLSEQELLSRLNLNSRTPFIGKEGEGFSFSLTPAEIQTVLNKYPYMISMGVLTDLSTIQDFNGNQIKEETITIPPPGNEPTIGVIDGAFDQSAYFSDWVDYYEEASSSDTRHGTSVSSLIVDGPSLNPDLEDGCGRFKVKHFSVMGSNERISQFLLYQQIESIVSSNPLIKVWNLSLGTEKEIEKNSISPMASLLDKLQSERDIIFVVSGTNNFDTHLDYPYIGAPADSINSIVVNSVTKDGKIPQYARKGPVLDFYMSPDLCAIGGDSQNPIHAYAGRTISSVWGTSYAACWVTRKLAYLIHYMNCTREEAKAILIDAAYGWSSQNSNSSFITGCGILPHHINSILETPNDEVKIVIKGCCDKYRTYSYNINVPLDGKGTFPYWAKATLCYFPKTLRKQGVDYAQTEIDLHFGRFSGELSVKSINSNHQGDFGRISTYEIKAIEDFEKWNCTKHVQDELNPRSRPKKVLFESPNGGKTYQPWGFYLLKARRTSYIEDNPHFALVLTFKSMDGKNRFNEFLQISQYSGWFTHILDPVVMHTIYDESQEEVEFD